MTSKNLKKLRTILVCFSMVFTITNCSENKARYIEFTKGRQMDPQAPRFGIKLSDDNHVYLCEEKMNSEEGSHALGYHTGKYRFYKSEGKIDFSKYETLILENFSTEIPRNFIKIDDATFEQINFNLENQNRIQNFYEVQLHSDQENIYNQIWKLKEELKFIQIDSVFFHQKLLQEKLSEPPPPLSAK